MGGSYETPKLVDMSELEMMNTNGGAVPLLVFILVAAVTVVAGAFVYLGGIGWTYLVGTSKVVGN